MFLFRSFGFYLKSKVKNRHYVLEPLNVIPNLLDEDAENYDK